MVALLLLGACTRTESSDLLTSGMSASINAASKGDGTTTVSATLYLGNPIDLNFVDLTGDDRLIATDGANSKVMVETIVLNIVSHTATFDSGGPGDSFSVKFQRSVDVGAPDTSMTLPDAFAFDAPPTIVSRTMPVTVAWSPVSTDLMSWVAEGDCIDRTGGNVAGGDPGTFEIPANALKQRQGATMTTCNVTITLTRSRDGHLDEHYGKGGDATGQQIRQFTYTSMP